MRKRYLIVAFISMLLFICNVEAMKFGDCEVLISFKQSSSLDEDSYVCKGKEYGSITDKVYYSGNGNEIKINKFDAYYLSAYENVTFDVSGENNISLLHLNNTVLNVVGSGSLKFKEGSFVKKVIAGEPIYQFVYDGRTIVDDNDKIYEGTVDEFGNNYSTLALKNSLPEAFLIDEYKLSQVIDFTNMTSVVITESWLEKHIDTKLDKTVLDGYGIIKQIEKKEEPKEETKVETLDKDKTLESDNVIFVSDKKVGKQYKLNVDDLNATDVAKEVSSQLQNTNLISFYDVNVYNGRKPVPMKNGSYTLKIKIDESNIEDYENYQIIYVNDNGEIEEYLEGVIEDGYIVFKTTHLSQYGVIAKEKVVPLASVSIESNSISYKDVLKVSVLASIIIGYIIIISILLVKSKLVKFKVKRIRKRTN